MTVSDLRRPSVLWGSILIALGVLLLMHTLRILPFDWWMFVWGGVAAATLVVIVRRVRAGTNGVFWWVMLFGFALYRFIDGSGWVDVPPWYGFPLLLIAAGVAFALMVVARPKVWHLAVPAAVLAGAGVALLLAEMGTVDYYAVRDVISSYWPAALIAYGGALLLSR